MKKIYALVLLTIALSASVAGCTVSQASDRDQYGNYLGEMSDGNAAMAQAREQYDGAGAYFTRGSYDLAIAAMNAAYGRYGEAADAYGLMASNASSQDQRAYAEALQSYAKNCMYAAASYTDAYTAYKQGDQSQGAACWKEAETFVSQANGYQDQAVRLQPMAIV